MYLAVGSYSGDGLDNRAISGVGFRPDLVIIKARDSAQKAVWRSSTMSGDKTVFFTDAAAVFADAIQSLEADGFTLGTHASVNSNGATYDWQAFADSGAGDFCVGYYTGDGTDNRNITGLGFDPDFVCVKRQSYGWYSRWRTSSNSGDQAMSFDSEADLSNEIQGFVTDGFQVGTNQNANGAIYYYWACKAVAGQAAYGSYTGNGADDRDITGVGFQPDLVWVKRASSLTAGVMRPSSVAGDSTEFFNTSAAAADHVQTLQSDGFQVGTLENASGSAYRWFAWKAAAPPPVTEKVAADAGTGAQAATLTVIEEKHGADAGAASETSLRWPTPVATSDQGVAAETATVWPYTETTRLSATVEPAVRDRVLLKAAVFHRRVVSRTRLQARVVPLLVDSTLLAAAVLNQAFEDAAAERVIAPHIEITFG